MSNPFIHKNLEGYYFFLEDGDQSEYFLKYEDAETEMKAYLFGSKDYVWN